MSERFDVLAPLGNAVQAIVVIPARDEKEYIEAALCALAVQRTRLGVPLDPRRFEVIVFANNCADDTAARARGFAAAHPMHAVHVIEATLPQRGNVGMARRAAMDVAARRLLGGGRPRGWIVSTDADSAAAGDWLAQTFAQTRVDAVFGRVVVRVEERHAFSTPAAHAYLLDIAHRRAVAHVEAALDPLAHDPAPRHIDQSSASLAVRADTYVRVGGLPPLACGEDAAFYGALERVDTLVRHSPHVRVATSARAYGRVPGGFSRLMRMVHAVDGPQRWFVENPEETLRRVRARAALRSLWNGTGGGSARAAVLSLYALDSGAFGRLYDGRRSCGDNVQRFELDACERRLYDGYSRVPVAVAVGRLRATLSRASRCAMRTMAASGPG